MTLLLLYTPAENHRSFIQLKTKLLDVSIALILVETPIGTNNCLEKLNINLEKDQRLPHSLEERVLSHFD